ncbi:MAG: hypothetical protein NVS1B4_22230 [Gemmatimonadaceae bacterium]
MRTADPHIAPAGARAVRTREKAVGWRSGFTVVELMVVIVVMGLLMTIALPKFHDMTRKADLTSAKHYVTSYLMTARATSLRRSRSAYFKRAGNTIQVTVDSLGSQPALIQSFALDSAFKVRMVTATYDSIIYNQRGFATNIATSATFVLAADTFTDSVCVTRLGTVLSYQCNK